MGDSPSKEVLLLQGGPGATHGSHLAMWDDSEVYFKGLINFINTVNNEAN